MNFDEVLKKRRTIRCFTQEEVSREKLLMLIDAARLAPSGGNMQPLRYLIIQDRKKAELVFGETAWAAFVKPGRTPEWGKNAPLTFILVTAPADAGKIDYANAGAAVENMLLKAVDAGLGCCWLGAFDHKAVRKILDIPENRDLLYLVAVGYPDEEPVMEDIEGKSSTRYYLDDADVLHVPKYTVDSLADWV